MSAEEIAKRIEKEKQAMTILKEDMKKSEPAEEAEEEEKEEDTKSNEENKEDEEGGKVQ
jgi:hypothetical protein